MIDVKYKEFAISELENEIDNIIEGATREAARRAKRLAPVDTGQLQNDIQYDENSVYNTVPYAPFVHDGTANNMGERYIERAMIQIRDEIL